MHEQSNGLLTCSKLYVYSTHAGENDLAAVNRAVTSIGANLRPLATQLGLAPGTVDRVMEEYTGVIDRLHQILLQWLKRNYDTDLHCLPSWRTLCAAVASEAGGCDKRLASEIAAKHPCVPAGIVLYMYCNVHRQKWRSST